MAPLSALPAAPCYVGVSVILWSLTWAPFGGLGVESLAEGWCLDGNTACLLMRCVVCCTRIAVGRRCGWLRGLHEPVASTARGSCGPRTVSIRQAVASVGGCAPMLWLCGDPSSDTCGKGVVGQELVAPRLSPVPRLCQPRGTRLVLWDGTFTLVLGAWVAVK